MAQKEKRIPAEEGRLITGSAGGVLLLYALWRRSWESLLVGPIGGLLLYLGITGQNPLVSMRTGGELGQEGIEVHRAVTIRRPPADVYDFWRQFQNLPRFIDHLESVEELGEGRSRWRARSMPGGVPLSWEVRLTADEPGQRLAWETLPEANVVHRGIVAFRPAGADEGTELHVEMVYAPAGGIVTTAAAQLLKAITAQQIKEEIRRCKQILEAGEIPTIEGQPTGREAR